MGIPSRNVVAFDEPDERRTQAVSPGPATLWPGVLVGAVVFAVLVLYWALRIRRAYFPNGDEFSLLVNSAFFFHPHAADWFRHGFAGYFCPYPDLSLPYSNFLRPLANVTYFVNSLVFGRHWSEYLLVNYLVQAALVVTVWYLARLCLNMTRGVALLVTVAAAVSPAFTYQALFRPSFAFDLLGGLWALLTLGALLRRRWVAAWVLVCLAVLTKESAYYTALAASGAVLLLRADLPAARRLLRSAAYLLPLAVVLLLRRLDFGGTQGVYVFNEATASNPVKRTVLALTHWPFSLPGEQHIFERSAHNLLALAVTAAAWILLAVFCLGVLRRRTLDTAYFAERMQRERRAVLLIFMAGSLLLPLALDLTARFGASTAPLFFLCLGALAADGKGVAAVRWASVAVLGVAVVADAAQLGLLLTGPMLQREQALWARSHSLIDLLGHEREPVVFLIGDASESFASPAFLQRFAGYPGTVVPLSNLGVGRCPGEQMTERQAPGPVYEVREKMPAACGGSALAATFHLTRGTVRQFTRSLPQAEVAYVASDGGWQNGQFSAQDLDLAISPKVSRFAIVYPSSESSPQLQQVAVGN